MERGNISRGRMDRSRLRGGVCRCLPGILLLVLAGNAVASTATFISDGALGSEISGAAARSLLQAKKSCPVDFEFMNYTIITSQCKGPQYNAKLCCKAFKDFACPYAEKLNDLTSDCSSTMFSYINLYGKYPPGLFSSECKESQRGLECPAEAQPDTTDANAATVALVIPTLGAVLTLFLLHFHLF